MKRGGLLAVGFLIATLAGGVAAQAQSSSPTPPSVVPARAVDLPRPIFHTMGIRW